MHHYLEIAGFWLCFLGIYIVGENPRWYCLLRFPYHLCTLAAPIFVASSFFRRCGFFSVTNKRQKKVCSSLQFTRCRGVRLWITRLNFTSFAACSVLHSCPWQRKFSRSHFGAALYLVLCLDWEMLGFWSSEFVGTQFKNPASSQGATVFENLIVGFRISIPYSSPTIYSMCLQHDSLFVSSWLGLVQVPRAGSAGCCLHCSYHLCILVVASGYSFPLCVTATVFCHLFLRLFDAFCIQRRIRITLKYKVLPFLFYEFVQSWCYFLMAEILQQFT